MKEIQDAGFQVSGVSPKISLNSRGHLQYVQRPTSPHFCKNAPSVSRIGDEHVPQGGMIRAEAMAAADNSFFISFPFSNVPGAGFPLEGSLLAACATTQRTQHFGVMEDRSSARRRASRSGRNCDSACMIIGAPRATLAVACQGCDHRFTYGSKLVITHRHFRRADRDEAPDFRAPLPGSPISESMCAWIALICSA